MVGVGSVVTPEVQQVTNQFEDLVEQRDVVGLGFIAIVGSVGVAIANEIVDLVVPFLGFNPDPQRASDFGVAGAVQVAWAAVLVTIAGSMLVGMPVLFSGAIALAIGAVIIGGANLFEFGQRMVARVTGSRPLEAASSRTGGSGNRSGRSPSGNTDTPSASTSSRIGGSLISG